MHTEKRKAHGDHILRLARQLADGGRPGVLATVDSDGLPHLRWMATLSLQEFPHLYAPLPTACALAVHVLRLGVDGVPQLPEEFAAC